MAEQEHTNRSSQGEQTDEVMRSKMLHIMFTRVPFNTALNITLEEAAPDGVTLRMPFSETVDNSGGTYHGGAVAALMDNAGAAAVWAGHDFSQGTRASTVSMAINYVGAGRTSDLIARARCVRRAKELNFTEIQIESDDGRPVASGVLVYRIAP
ncbi:PaaI family thioesterase [Candidatus Poriferisocius sp.]|uniref:PaaI family thioesterase n=1 Tax=Candidatus Poriferisocius sp. TaxID=3101276 RepID=UPI003B5A943E